jgi:hypothetical protein
MHKHEHCQHGNLKYCQHCDVVYCVDCGREWGVQNNWTYYPATPVKPGYPFVYCGTGTTSGNYTLTATNTICSHSQKETK